MKLKYIPILIGALIVLLIIPLILNFILRLNSPIPIIGNSESWLLFWGTYIGAIASFIMIGVTFLSLLQNQKELTELKRQWEESHRPILSCKVIVYKFAYVLQICNTGTRNADNVKITFGNDFLKHLQDQDRKICENTMSNPIIIPINQNWNIIIGDCDEIIKEWGNLQFNIKVNIEYNYKYEYSCSIPITTFINRTNLLIQSPLEELADGLVKVNSLHPHKSAQVSLEMIAKQLQSIQRILSKIYQGKN